MDEIMNINTGSSSSSSNASRAQAQAQTARANTNNAVGTAEEAEFKQRLDAHAAAWSNALTNSEAPAQFYAPDADVVCFDVLPPFAGYIGWKQFKNSLSNSITSAKFTMHDGLRVKRNGNVAWTTGSFHILIELKNGGAIEGDARQTAFWEKRDGKWLIVHMHESMPLPDGCAPYQATTADLHQMKN